MPRKMLLTTIFGTLMTFLMMVAPMLRQSVTAQPPNSKGQSVRQQATIAQLPSRDKRFALIIGIDEYEKDVSSLKGAVNDARALKDVLVNHAGFPENQITLLTSGAMTSAQLPRRANILEALDNLSNQMPEDGLLLFSFSGHGVSVDNAAYLIPSDGKITRNLKLLRDYSIDVKRIKETIEELKVKQVLMLLDACRNVPGKGEMASPLTEAYKNGFSFDVTNSEVKAFATLYATTIGERAFEFLDSETRQYRGYFSYAIEQGMKGKAVNPRGQITLGSLISYIENTVPKRVRSEKGEAQEPSKEVVGFKESELVLALANGAPMPSKPVTPPPPVTNSGTGVPRSPQELYARSMAYFNQRNFDQALVEINQAIELSPIFAQAYVVRASIAHVKNNHDQTIADCTKAIELGLSNNDVPYLVRGASFNVKGRVDDALADFNKAIQFNPQSGPAYAGRGVSYKGKGDLKNALADFTKGIQLSPREAQTYYNRAIIYIDQKAYDAALSDLNQVIALDPTLAVGYQTRALVYERKGDTTRAEADRQKFRSVSGIQ